MDVQEEDADHICNEEGNEEDLASNICKEECQNEEIVSGKMQFKGNGGISSCGYSLNHCTETLERAKKDKNRQFSVCESKIKSEAGFSQDIILASSFSPGDNRERSDSILKKFRNMARKLSLKKNIKNNSSSNELQRSSDSDDENDFAEHGNSQQRDRDKSSRFRHSRGKNLTLECENNDCLVDISDDVNDNLDEGFIERSGRGSSGDSSDDNFCNLNVQPASSSGCEHENIWQSPNEQSAPVTPYIALSIEPFFSSNTTASETSISTNEGIQEANSKEVSEKSDVETEHDSGIENDTAAKTADRSLDSFFNHCWKELCQSGWYWGPLTAKRAEDILLDKPCGSYLVRDSNNDMYILSLSYRAEDSTRHIRIRYSQGNFSFTSQPSYHARPQAPSVKKLIECFQGKPSKFHTVVQQSHERHPLKLELPVLRSDAVPSLQYLCRLVIRWNVWIDDINELPLSRHMLWYLKARNYFIDD